VRSFMEVSARYPPDAPGFPPPRLNEGVAAERIDADQQSRGEMVGGRGFPVCSEAA